MGKAKYQRLGEFIEQFNVRNRNLSVTNLMGVSIEKRFIPSIANTIGTDLAPYKIVKPRQFAYGPVTSRNGNKITIALYNGDEDCIISQAYEAFKVKDENQLLPEYLMMWAKRPEFDRYARYMSHGSVREIFSWEDMCNVMLPVPPIAEQRRIVSEYQTVERRIANNEALIQKLEDTAQAIYHHTFVEGIDEEKLPEGWRLGTLSEIAEFSNGRARTASNGEYPIYGGNGIVGYSEEANSENVIVIGRVGANCGCIYYNKAKCWVNDNAIKAKSRKGFNYYLYFHLKAINLNSMSEGSGQPLLTQTILNGIRSCIPSLENVEKFNNVAHNIFDYQYSLQNETLHLRTLLSLLTSKLA